MIRLTLHIPEKSLGHHDIILSLEEIGDGLTPEEWEALTKDEQEKLLKEAAIDWAMGYIKLDWDNLND